MICDCARRLAAISYAVLNIRPLEHHLYALSTLSSRSKASDTDYDVFPRVKKVLYHSWIRNECVYYIDYQNYSGLESQE